MRERLGILTADIWALRGDLEAAFGCEPVRLRPALARGCDAVLGWGDARGRSARWLARVRSLPFRSLSEAPLRSVRPDGTAPLGLVLAGHRAGPAEPGRAADALEQIRRLRLSWRNDGRPAWPSDLGPLPRALVVVDRPGCLDGVSLPAGPVAILSDSRLSPALAIREAGRRPGLVAASGVDPWVLFDAVGEIHAPDGDLARLAVLAGRTVSRLPGGAAPSDPAAIVAEFFLEQPRWFDPWSRRETTFEAAADALAWLRDRFRDNARRSVAVGVSRWKQARIAGFLDGPEGGPDFVTTPEAAVARAGAVGGGIVAWETRMPRRLETACAEAGVPLARMEDGFLRSVGLGAAFLPGASCVLDGRGIYYDPGRESDLERILAHAAFDDALLARAAALRTSVVGLRLSKYNVGRSDAALALPAGRRVVLVPGQVEDDASVMLGSPAVPGNRALLRAARAGNPDAFLVFKPHPDVEAGLRKGRIPEADALAMADRVIGAVPIVDLLDRVESVETMTSLAGFEALLRGRRVVVHGRPFYAGWGLTEDRDPMTRRTRRLTLDALVAGALILYPRYLDPVTGLRCPPEVLVRRLAEARDQAGTRSPAGDAARALHARARHALLGPLGLSLRRMRGAVRDSNGPGTDPGA